MISDVHEQLGLLEVLNAEGIANLLHGLLGKGGNINAQDEDGVRYAFLLHPIGIHLDGLDAHLFIFGEEHEQLIGLVVGFFLFGGRVALS